MIVIYFKYITIILTFNPFYILLFIHHVWGFLYSLCSYWILCLLLYCCFLHLLIYSTSYKYQYH